MYQIIECTDRIVVYETDNLDRAIERFEYLQSGVPNILFRQPLEKIKALVLQKVERIDQWQRIDK